MITANMLTLKRMHFYPLQFADENDINFFEVSAKNRNNVEKVRASCFSDIIF